MNYEALFFTSAIRSRDLEAFQKVNPEHLSDDYKRMHDYVVHFIREYSRLPLFDTVNGNFPGLLSNAHGGEEPEYYADRIRENAMRVDLEDALNEKVAAPLSEQRAHEALAGTRQVVSEISERYREDWEGTKLDDISFQVQQRMEAYRLRKAAQGAVGLPTPWRTLTNATGGLQEGDAAAVLARMNMGKSWALILWAVYLWQLRFRVLFVSMETPAHGKVPRDRTHRMIGKMCFRCYQVEPEDSSAECPAASIPRQRLSIRFDALGARLSAWKLYKGWLSPFEEEKLERYYAACATKNDGKWGDLRICASPYIQSIGDLEMEILSYRPDVVFWDSAYLAAQPTRGRKENRWASLVRSFKLMLERVGIPGVVSWHFNRDVTEKAMSASMNSGALTDELPRVFDTIIGLFRPPELEEADEALWKGLKTRDGIRMGTLRTNFQLVDGIDFSEITTGDE